MDWSKDELRVSIASALGKPDWRRGAPGIPGGREVAKEIIETAYANRRAPRKFNGCASYADFRELLENEKDLNAVKIMTPDHLHATIAIAAMKKGKHVLLHKTDRQPASRGHPNYTHAVFRGWYEFGGGSLADMGRYSLWPVFRLFDLDAPIAVESRPSHLCMLERNVAITIRRDYSFPAACTIRFKFAAKGNRLPLDLFWYDGSMKPPTPEELEEDNHELEAEGLMFIGDKGKILAGFRGQSPRIIPERKMREYRTAKNMPETTVRRGGHERARSQAIAQWVGACKGSQATHGDFLLAGPISDAVNLGAVSLRLGGRRLLFDAAAMKVTNLPEANKCLIREYRTGWELSGGGV
ncbi:MAG: Gfo/Idh/MocA family oxidoreductase [Verrucomicrobiota bacterium]